MAKRGRKPSKRIAARNIDIRGLRKLGWTLQRIASRYHRTRERIRQICEV